MVGRCSETRHGLDRLGFTLGPQCLRCQAPGMGSGAIGDEYEPRRRAGSDLLAGNSAATEGFVVWMRRDDKRRSHPVAMGERLQPTAQVAIQKPTSRVSEANH